MADIYWPGGITDIPLKDTLQWAPVESGDYASAAAGALRAAPRAMGFAVDMTADFDMSLAQFNGLFLPWWRGRAAQGGCDNGVTPFWLRDPFDLIPYRWVRQEGQKMQPQPDGWGLIVRLPLRRLPQ